MQTLWSRVAQVRATCRCPQCLNTANGVSRRATASATRRMPRYLYSSTLWYSGIFAAAASFDASRKERRKEQWDRVIAEVRQELEQPSSVNQQQVADDVETYDHATNVLDNDTERYLPLGDLEDENGAKVDGIDDGLEALKPLDGLDERDIFQLVDPTRPRPQYPVSTGPELCEWDLAPQSIYAQEWAKKRAELLRWTPKKLATVQKCTELLQLQIIRSIHIHGLEEEAAAAVPDGYARFIRQSRESLRNEFHTKLGELLEIKKADAQLSDYQSRVPESGERLCHYAQDSQGHFHDTARDVNRSLRTLFSQRRAEQISQGALLAKVAYTLYISPAPPNIDTFNTLLIGLRHAGEESLVGKVIINMHESHMRANEVSFVTKLEHYIEGNDLDNFVRAIETIRGKHGGPMLARPSVRIATPEAAKKLRRVEVEGRNGLETKVIQLPTPTPMVFGTIINGVLKFAGFETALSICEGMGKEGWGLCMAGLTPLLKDCAERGDWTSGLAVWTQIQALKIKSDRRRKPEKIGIEAFAAMLRLCTTCDQKDTFDSIWRQASVVWKHSMGKLVSLVKGEDPTTTSDRIGKRVRPMAKARLLDRDTVDFSEGRSDADTQFWQEYDSDLLDDQSDVPEGRRPEQEQGSFMTPVLPTQTAGEQEATASQPQDEPKSVLPAVLPPRPIGKQEATAMPPQEECVSVSPPVLLTQTTEKQNGTAIPPHQSIPLLERQLLGTLPPSHELDDYELRERPMSASG